MFIELKFFKYEYFDILLTFFYCYFLNIDKLTDKNFVVENLKSTLTWTAFFFNDVLSENIGLALKAQLLLY